MGDLSTARLLAFARELQRVTSYGELVLAIAQELEASVGYKHAWLFVADEHDPDEVRLIDVAGAIRGLALEVAPVLKIRGDAMMEEILSSDRPVIVEDARTDPRTNKEIVAALHNRTLINIPLRLLDKPFGAFGTGTFGDEGCRAPTPQEIDYIVGMGSQLSVAAGRIRWNEERRATDLHRAELEKRIVQMQKLESLGMLAAGVAHDFNNLLTVILTHAGFLARSSDPQAQSDGAAILAAAERASQLSRQLLAMGRMQSLEPKPIDINDRVRQLVALLERVLPENIELDVITGERLPLVEADPSQIDQVMMNLCVNAKEAMPKGGRLTIETEQVLINGSYVDTHPWAKPGRYVLISVTDTGTGMTQSTIDRVFDPFFTTKWEGESPGTGLGLAVSWGIVRQHAGMLHCYSEVGVGTTFKVYLPAHLRSASDVGTKIEPAVIGGNENILIAEDNYALRKAMMRVLEAAGYRVRAVEDGHAACEAAAAETFDLIILDIVMPAMGGPEALERIHVLQPRARFILSTGYAAEPNAKALVDRKMASFLPKPYHGDLLLRAVRTSIDSRQNDPPS
jgi:signal transduction histidine kinase/ActR/RegA family two-component response regulator